MDAAYYFYVYMIINLSINILDDITNRVARLEIRSVLEKLGDFLLLILALWYYGGVFYLDFKWPWLYAIYNLLNAINEINNLRNLLLAQE